MIAHRQLFSDALAMVGVCLVAVLLGVLAVKAPLLAIAGAALTALVLIAAVNVTLPVAAWLIVAPFVQAVEPGSSLLLLTIAFHRALLPIVGLSVLLGQSVRRELRLLASEKLLLAFLIYACASLVVTWRGEFGTVAGSEALRTFLLSYVVPFGALLMATRLPQESHRRILGVLVVVSAVISTGGVIQTLTSRGLFPGAQVWLDVWNPRAVGSLANPAVSAYVAQVGVFAAVYLGLKFVPWRVVAIPGVLAGTAFTIVTYTRSAWMALAVGTVAVAWLFKRARPWVLSAVVLAAAAFTFNVGGFVDTAFLEERAGDQENVEGRVAFGSTGIRMFTDSPVTGQGLGRYDIESKSFAVGYGTVGAAVSAADTSHNTFLTILAELGAVGFILYGAAIYTGLRHGIAALRGREPGVDRLKIVALLAGVLSFFVSANLIDMRFFSFAYALFWFNVGLLDVSARRPQGVSTVAAEAG